jgi:hypothetical protein
MQAKLDRPNLVADALYNSHPQSGASDDYSQGVVVGVIATLMAIQNDSFEDAARFVADKLPLTVEGNRLPKAFRAILQEMLDVRVALIRR